MSKNIDDSGFTAPAGRALGRERRRVAVAELVATIALALCTLVAVTVVSVGIARADIVGNVVGHESSLFGVALVLGLLFIAVGGISAFPRTPGTRKSRRG
jgi:uncharacterized membrane protein YuzA (DUF378 family)